MDDIELTETGRPRRASTRGINFVEPTDSEDEPNQADSLYNQGALASASDPAAVSSSAQVGPSSQNGSSLVTGRPPAVQASRLTLGGALSGSQDPGLATRSQGSIEWHPSPVRPHQYHHFHSAATYLPPPLKPPMQDRQSESFGASLMSYSLSSPTYAPNTQYSFAGPSRPPQLAPIDYRFGWPPPRQESSTWSAESIGGIDYSNMGPEQPVARWHGGLPGFAHQAPPRIEGDYRDSRRPSVASSFDQYTPLSPTDSEIAENAYYEEDPMAWPMLEYEPVQLEYDPVQASKPKSHGRKRPPGHIARPPNQFLLYRSHVIKNNLIPSALEIRDHKQISMIVGQMWQALSPDKKSYWAQKAQRVKEEHARMYPHFSQTRKTRKTNSRKEKTNSRDKLRCEAVAKVLIETAGDGLGAMQPAADIQAGTLEAVDLNDKVNAAMRQASYHYGGTFAA